MRVYDENTAPELVKEIIDVNVGVPSYQRYYFQKLRRELQVHTHGRIFEKVVTVFQNEDPESSKFVLDTYEAITKASIWRGIDNLARIFHNTGFTITGDADTIKALNEVNFFNDYIDKFISISTATDPNTLQVWYKGEDKWVNRFVETQFVTYLTDDAIAFIVPEESEYEIVIDNQPYGQVSNYYSDYSPTASVGDRNNFKVVRRSYFEGTRYNFTGKVKYVYISREQYAEIVYNKAKAEVTITNFDVPLKSAYTYTGVEYVEKGVYNTAMSGFIPFGNHCLIQHRTFRSVEAVFGYPRMSELEIPCDTCVSGQEACEPCEQYPSGLMPCRKCNGSGSLSLQSPFKIYKRKVFPDAPELNAAIKPVEFFTPDIGILQYNSTAWRDTLQLAEDAVYIQARVETGNVESAKSREKAMESMYAWLARISGNIFDNIQKCVDNYCTLNGYEAVTIEPPTSFAIVSELEAFEYLNSIVNGESPLFIKATRTENFLSRYTSKTSPINKIVDVLKNVDPFLFYPNKDLQDLSNSGVIDDVDWKVHSYAYPLLQQLYAKDSTLLEQPTEVIIQRLNELLVSKSASTLRALANGNA